MIIVMLDKVKKKAEGRRQKVEYNGIPHSGTESKRTQ
jgi:hypothetical protein